MTATIFDIDRGSMVDGPGIRTTVFFKGCNLRCGWCHNPESQSAKKQLLFYKDKCVGCGKCLEVCPKKLKSCDFCGECEIYCQGGARKICGKDYTADELLGIIEKNRIFYETSGGGATFSGGECMLQIDFLTELTKKCREAGINTAIDTAGDLPWEYFEKVIPYTDIFLYDVKCVTEEKHIEGTGVSNRRILENLRRLSDSFSGKIIIRIPVICGFNDSPEELDKIAGFIRGINHEKAEALPYHSLGEHKYTALGRTPHKYSVPDENTMKRFRKALEA